MISSRFFLNICRLLPLIVGALAAVTGRPSVAQPLVTIRNINAIPRENIHNLNAGGADLVEADVRALIESPLEGDTVTVEAVVMSNPRNSGAAEVLGGRVARIHFFIRDIAADSAGNDGMGIQVVDDRWDQHGTLELVVGDVVRITGLVSEFQGAPVIRPMVVERTGWFEDLGFGLSLLGAEQGLAAETLNRSLGKGRFQAVWEVIPRLHGSPVCLSGALVTRVSTSPAPGRVDWAVTTSGGALVYAFDTSLRFRNDRSTNYPAEFNTRTDDFTPPPVGASVRLCGFVVLQAFNDPDGISIPTATSTGSMLSLAPFEDADLSVLALPPEISSVSRPGYVHGPRASYLASATVVTDPARDIVSVTLTSIVDVDTTRSSMYRRSASEWSQTIPATRRDGAVVRYFVDARDNAGAVTRSPELQFRVLEDGIMSIAEIQTTYQGGPGPSPFEGLRLPMEIVARLHSEPSSSGLYSVQDDTSLAPWSAIGLDPGSVAGLGIGTGDLVRITSGRIEERDGATLLSDVALVLIEQGNGVRPRHQSISSFELTRPAAAESFEGMTVRIEPATVVHDWDNGEWSISNGSLSDTIRVAAKSPSVPDDALSIWETRPFVQGLWTQDGGRWILVPESPADLGEIVNVGIHEAGPLSSEERGLSIGAYPNPFAAETSIAFEVPNGGDVRVEVFDITGRPVAVLVDRQLPSGRHVVPFSTGRLPAGAYLVRLSTPAGSTTGTAIRTE